MPSCHGRHASIQLTRWFYGSLLLSGAGALATEIRNPFIIFNPAFQFAPAQSVFPSNLHYCEYCNQHDLTLLCCLARRILLLLRLLPIVSRLFMYSSPSLYLARSSSVLDGCRSVGVTTSSSSGDITHIVMMASASPSISVK